MSNDREVIYGRIRAALAGRETREPRPEIDWARVVAEGRLAGGDLWAAFRKNFTGVRGKWCETVGELAEFLKAQDCGRGYCDPALRAVGEALGADLEVEYSYGRDRLDTLRFGITRATAVVAETGSILLTDEDTVNRLAALAPWVHVAVVAKERIYRTVREAILDLPDDPNIVWVTGPSKTADIEGILIEGVHGPGEQVCLWGPG